MSEHDPRAWKAVGEAMEAQRNVLKMTQDELHAAAQVSIFVIAELEKGVIRTRRAPGTLARLSQALRWPETYLDDILDGRATPDHGTPEQAVGHLTASEESLRSIGEKLDNVNGKLDALLKHYDIVWRPSPSSEISVELAGYSHGDELPEHNDDGPSSLADE